MHIITTSLFESIISEIPFCERVIFCVPPSNDSSTTFILEKFTKVLGGSPLLRSSSSLLIFIPISSSSSSSASSSQLRRETIAILFTFILSVLPTSRSSSFEFGVCELSLNNNIIRREDDNDDDPSVGEQQQSKSNNNNNFLQIADIKNIQLLLDPIYSPIIIPDDNNDENSFFTTITDSTSIIIPEELIIHMTDRLIRDKRAIISDFVENTLLNKAIKKTVKLNFKSMNGDAQISSSGNNEVVHHHRKLIERFLSLSNVLSLVDNIGNKKTVDQKATAWRSTAASVDERKWSVWATQKILAAPSSSSSSIKNNSSMKNIKTKTTDENIHHHQQKDQFQGLTQDQVKIAAAPLQPFFDNSFKGHFHYERMFQDASKTIIDRRKQHASPLRKIVSYFSPSAGSGDSKKDPSSRGSNNEDGSEEGDDQHLIMSPDRNNNNNNNHASSFLDDETDAILKALTEKKKSLTLAKRAEEWFAELSSKDVPQSLKPLAMAIPYHYRFWLTPMGFFVIGSCLMMLFGSVLLFV